MGQPWVIVNLGDMEPAADWDSYTRYDVSSALGLDQMRANVFRQKEPFYVL